MINSFGASVIAGYSAAIKLNNLVITSFSTLGNGVSNYAAQNIGANKTERINAGFGAGLKLVWLLCVPFFLFYFFAGHWGLLLFMDHSSENALVCGQTFLRIVSPFYFIVSMKLVADGILRGAGLMKQFMITTFTDLVLRVVLAFVLSGIFGSTGIWMAWPVGWSIATTMSIMFYRKSFGPRK